MKKFLIALLFIYLPIHIYIIALYSLNLFDLIANRSTFFDIGGYLNEVPKQPLNNTSTENGNSEIFLPNLKSMTIYTDQTFKVFNNRFEIVAILPREDGNKLLEDKSDGLNSYQLSNGIYTYKIERYEESQPWKYKDKTFMKIGSGKFIEILKDEPLNVSRSLLAVLPNGDLIFEDYLYSSEIIKSLEQHMEYYGKSVRKYYKRETTGKTIYLGSANISGSLERLDGFFNQQYLVFEKYLFSSFNGYIIVDVLNNKIDSLDTKNNSDGRKQVFSQSKGKIIFTQIETKKDFQDILTVNSYDVKTRKITEIGKLVLKSLSPEHFLNISPQAGDITSSYAFSISPDNTKVILQTVKIVHGENIATYSDLQTYLIDLNDNSTKLVNQNNGVYCSLGYYDLFYNFLLSKDGTKCLVTIEEDNKLYESGKYYIDQTDFLNPNMIKIPENILFLNVNEDDYLFVNIE